MTRRPDFAARLLAWYDHHGRRDLPWKKTDPYPVWVSEIMLQQTQVATVIPYFERFMAAFPDVAALAVADIDAVLAHWAGLGYYARARNLHRAADVIVAEHGGDFPDDIEALTALPGIGRSTAGAILSQALGQRHPILDGNVKRVLTRLCRIEGDPAASAVSRRLWALADELTPDTRCGDYTQAVMDLGATVCTRTRPACGDCPAADLCAARAAGDVIRFPEKKRKTRPRPRRSARFLLLRDAEGRLLLERRPPAGIWGGLWCPPEVEDPGAWCRQRLGADPGELREIAPFEHKFTHFDLEIRPLATMVGEVAAVADDALRWHDAGQLASAGLPAPMRRLVEAGA